MRFADVRQRTPMVCRCLISILLLISAERALAQPSVLFIRGAERSGGFLEAENNEQRTEQLADIHNSSTAPGNHGWFDLAQTLRDAGFLVTQIIEPLENQAPNSGPTQGAPIAFESFDLASYDIVVMGSNNAVYSGASIGAFEQYIRGGGSALFISDAGFGSNWADASNSDQQFLDRFGWVIQQDAGTYHLSRQQGDFITPQHPVLLGINAIAGEGVSPGVWTGVDLPGIVSTPLVRAAPGDITRNNDGVPGSIRATAPTDAASIVAQVGCGRIAIHLDRNTFFNSNGAGANLHQLDHREYAINLLSWLSAGGVDADDDGLLGFDDVLLFLSAFVNASPDADLAAPFGEYDISDILSFLDAYTNRCF